MEQSGQDGSNFRVGDDDVIDLRDPVLALEVADEIIDLQEYQKAARLNAFMSLGMSVSAEHVLGTPARDIYIAYLQNLQEVADERQEHMYEPGIQDDIYDALFGELNAENDAQFRQLITEVIELKRDEDILPLDPDAQTRLQQFDAAVRTACESHFLNAISPYVANNRMPPVPPFCPTLLFEFCDKSLWEQSNLEESNKPMWQQKWMERVQATILEHDLMKHDLIFYVSVV